MTLRSASQAGTPSSARLAADPRSARPHRGRQGRAAAPCAHLPARPRPPPHRGHSGRRQVDAGAGARRRRSASSTRASSSRATCCRRTCSASRSTTSATRRSASTPGPIFNSVVLADEINRAPPKTQSALLEAMEERQVSQDGADAQAARSVLRHRDAESHRADRRLSAARVAARSLPHGDRARLSRRRRGARAALGRRPPRAHRRLAAARRPGHARRLAARGLGDSRRARAARLRAGAARGHARAHA